MNKNHYHKLRRHSYKNGESVFFCVDENCKFKINISLSIGKRARCWRCGDSFILNEYSIRLAKPHCEDCTKKKNDTTLAEIIPEKVNHAKTPDSALSLRERLLSTIGQDLKKDYANDEGDEEESSSDLL